MKSQDDHKLTENGHRETEIFTSTQNDHKEIKMTTVKMTTKMQNFYK